MPESSPTKNEPDPALAPGLQDIFDNAPIGIFTSTPDGRYISVNAALAKMYGYDSPEELGESVTNIATQIYADPNDRKEFTELLKEHGEVVDHECRFKRKDGSIIWVSRNVRAVRDQDGNVVAYQGFTSDISGRKQTDWALRERIKELNCLYGISKLIETGKNPDAIFQGVADLLPKSWQYPEIACARIIVEGREYLAGNFCVTDWRQSVVLQAHGETVGMIDVCYLEQRPVMDEGPFLKEERLLLNAIAERLGEFIERTQAEEALRKSEERFSLAMEAAKDGLWDWDVRTGNVYYSPGYARMLGYKPSEFLGHLKTWIDLLHPEDKEKAITASNDCIENRVECFAVEFRMQAKNGDWRWILGRGRVVFRDKFDRATRIIGTHTDVTERKQTEEQIRSINEQLQQSNAGKDKLFFIIAHDLKSPMCGLLGSTEMLANQARIFSEQEIQLLSSELHKSAKNAFALLEDLLQWSRMSQGGIDYAPSPCSLNELINMGLYSAKDIAKRKNVAILSNIPPSLTVIVDQPMLKTVIRNILFNAIKFSERGGDIVINAHQDEQVVTVAITDNGIGMNQSTLSSIFSFEKAKRLLGTEGEKGTGLGLVLCKQFIEQHGGEIWVESEPGKGTTVYFSLFQAESSPG